MFMNDFVPPAISMDQVCKIYPPRTRKGEAVEAIENISFTVSRGEFVSLVGPSGCGKSTLIKILAGLLPISKGVISVDGEAVRGPHSDIGIVFQSPVLLKWRTVLDNVLFPIDILKLPRKRYLEQAEELLRLVGLWEFRHEYPRILSGGMQQRVSLCRSLIHDPSLLVMDEPFGALDAFTRDEMNLELLQVWSQRQKTILFITHSISEAVLLSERVIVLSARPSTVDTVFSIDLPRPRTLDIRYTQTFQDYTREIQSRIVNTSRNG
ncbi:MAG TPA: ABC transporter ATP-binding protein [Anaerolineae bacterium]|nr:ABC transporter ATP-binding protein [Anaerolineae bacterium]HMR65855.1 ABC transporter ATP-binding protein [Anaerolineae bacterium]